MDESGDQFVVKKVFQLYENVSLAEKAAFYVLIITDIWYLRHLNGLKCS